MAVVQTFSSNFAHASEIRRGARVRQRKSGCPQKKHGMLGPKAGMHDGLEEGQVSVNFVTGKL